MKSKLSITIGWLYPELMSTYGDRGNVLVLQKRCEWRGINVNILPIQPQTSINDLQKCDLIFGGGAQDREQEIVMNDLLGKKGGVLKELIEKDKPALFVCGSPQLMGTYYEPAEGQRIEGLGIFDMETRHPGLNSVRLIGNIAVELLLENLKSNPRDSTSALQNDSNKQADKIIVGFENHGGRTYLGKNSKPFAKVIKGFGNNGEDDTEGVVYKNAVGTYLHGPLLPKNPFLADYLIQKALEVKYTDSIILEKLDDSLENQARKTILRQIN